MLVNEGSGGIHNFPWTSQVLSATAAAIATAGTATANTPPTFY